MLTHMHAYHFLCCSGFLTSLPMMFALFLISLLGTAQAFRTPFLAVRVNKLINAIPLELEGQLDEKKSWEVKFIFNGEEKVCTVPESVSILEYGESIFKGVESSCRNGICTTCAAKIVDGKESTLLAVSGLGQPQIDAGFVCACQCFVTGPGVTVQLGQYDECYELQYGQYERSYEMKFSKNKKDEPKKGLFGL